MCMRVPVFVPVNVLGCRERILTGASERNPSPAVSEAACQPVSRKFAAAFYSAQSKYSTQPYLRLLLEKISAAAGLAQRAQETHAEKVWIGNAGAVTTGANEIPADIFHGGEELLQE